MKSLTFARRNFKELFRDPVSLIFSLGLPLFLLIVFQQFKIPSEIYSIDNFAPSIIIFSFSFLALFAGLLISRDRTSSFLTRLFVSPMTSWNYIFGYVGSLLPISIIQTILFILVASFFGLKLTIYSLLTVLIMIPVAMLFISLGVLIGCAFNDKQSSAISSIVIQLVAFTSGMWFDVNMSSSGFKYLCNILPFRYGVDLARCSIKGDFSNIIVPFIIVIGYTIIVFLLASLVFKKKMISDNK